MKSFVIPKKLKSNAYYKKELSTITTAVNLNGSFSDSLISEIYCLKRWWKPSEWEELIFNLDFLVACTTPVVDSTTI